MGNKVSPSALRYGVNKDWQSRWYTTDNKEMARWILEDNKIRKVLFNNLKLAGVSKIEIERTKTQIILFIHSVRVGSVLGQGATNLEKLKKLVRIAIKNRKIDIDIKVVEIANPDLDAQILANAIALQIENRSSHRAAQKLAIRKSLRAGVKGIRTKVSGRLGGADMARTEGYSEGSVPLSTIRGNIEFAKAEANTVSGKIGVKVTVYKGDILSKEKLLRENNFNPRNRKNINNQNNSNLIRSVNNRMEAK